MDFQKDEIFDKELQEMGIPYEDETVPKEMQNLQGYTEKGGNEKMPCRKEPVKTMGTPCVRAVNAEANLLKRGLGCMKWVLPCGGISMLLWWFQVNDLMAMVAAYPCIVACGIIGGIGFGMNIKK